MIPLALIVLRVKNTNLIAMQRRSSDAQEAPGEIGFFGGHVEVGEEPLAAALRELAEETSLDVGNLTLTPILVSTIPSADRVYRINLYETTIDSPEFAVYEGDGVELVQWHDIETTEGMTAGVIEIIKRWEVA